MYTKKPNSIVRRKVDVGPQGNSHQRHCVLSYAQCALHYSLRIGNVIDTCRYARQQPPTLVRIELCTMRILLQFWYNRQYLQVRKAITTNDISNRAMHNAITLPRYIFVTVEAQGYSHQRYFVSSYAQCALAKNIGRNRYLIKMQIK